MARPVPRVPPIWIVLVPLAVLAWLGVTAARNEAEAGRSRAAARAEAAAVRLVRSIRTVAGEFAQGLAGADGEPVAPRDALESARHLFPRRLVDAQGRPLDPTGAAPRAMPEPVRAFVADALATAAKLGDDAAGIEARAAFLVGAGAAAEDADAGALLELAASAAERALDGGAFRSESAQTYERLLAGIPDTGDDLRAALLAAAEGDDPPPGARDIRRGFETARDAVAEALASRTAVVRLVARANELGILVASPVIMQTGAGPRDACLVGEVPAGTVRTRIAKEADALAAEAALPVLEILAPDGSSPVASGSGTTGADDIEAWIPLGAPLDAWRVHAVAAGDAGGERLAAIMLAVVAIAATALAWGVFAMRRAASEHARLAAERQTFLDHVAHEVRTPAGALLALSEELDAGRVPAPRQPKYHAHLAEESRRLARLVEDTLDLSRLDAGRLVFRKEDGDLRAAVADGIRAAGAEDRVTFRAPPDVVIVRMDAAAVRRLVRNVVDNALRHGAAEPQPEVTVSADDRTARVTVRDHGAGIAPDELPRLFERFRRPASDTHDTKGVGVGLAICRELARAHGGDVTASSEPGKGATFVVTLPRDGGDPR